MATIGQQETGLTKEEVLQKLAAAGNVKAKEALAGGSTPTVKTSSKLGDQETGLTEKQVIDRLAGAGNVKAQEAQKNDYTIPPLSQTTKPVSESLSFGETAAPQQSSLVDFAHMLDQATKLARQTSQANELGILEQYGFKPGQVKPGTMGDILNLLQTSHSGNAVTLQNAAIQAFETEQKKKQVDIENKQQLQLSMLTSGMGLSTEQLNALSSMPDFDSSINYLNEILPTLKSSKYSDFSYNSKDGRFYGQLADGSGMEAVTPPVASTGTGSGELTANQKDYNFAVQNGYKGTFAEWVNKGGGIDSETPKYASEYLDLGDSELGFFDTPKLGMQFGDGLSEREVNMNKLAIVGVTTDDIAEIERLLGEGYTLQQIAESTNMPNVKYQAVKKFLKDKD